MRVTVDRDRCIGAGLCVISAPAVFDQDEDDAIVLLRDATPPPSARAAITEAADRCPAAVITLHDP